LNSSGIRRKLLFRGLPVNRGQSSKIGFSNRQVNPNNDQAGFLFPASLEGEQHHLAEKAGKNLEIERPQVLYSAVLNNNSFKETSMLGPQSSLVMYDEEYQRIMVLIEKLQRESNSKVIFLVDKNGQLIAATGETEHLDTTSLASLTAGNIAATGGLAKLIGEKEFSILFHEGEKDNIHISIIGGRVILVVIFDERSSLGLVRLRVKKASEELGSVFEDLVQKTVTHSEKTGTDSPFAEITDDDIDNLFN
jgi:predicted regulator of Ras-like GTPase activity (Roadblock/LC7/MglB family)